MSYTVYLEFESVNSTHIFEHITDSSKVGRNYSNYSRIKPLYFLKTNYGLLPGDWRVLANSVAMIQHGKNWQQYAKHRIAKIKLGKM